MLSLEDCLGLCELTEAEIEAIAEHEHIPEIAAVELGHYLEQTPRGELTIKEMMRDDICAAAAAGDWMRSLGLKLVLREYILRHPRCEQRHVAALRLPDRRN